jgi:CubicO group peptidase (beta-lactamase class C family)
MHYRSKRYSWYVGLTLLVILMVLLVNLSLDSNRAIVAQETAVSNLSDEIHNDLADIIVDSNAPGIIVAIISSDGVIAIGSAGVRKAGSEIVITTDDKVHLGSCTKVMTSVMLATLVADGKLSWDMKLTEAIPEFEKTIHPDFQNATLWQFLTHRTGLHKNPSDWSAHTDKEITERRLAILQDNLVLAASSNIGEFHYSNLGYMIAACMAEKVTGMSWEVLIRERLFEPLGMSSAGFGAPNTHNQIDQPWGHSWEFSLFGNNWEPDQTDNPKALGPAGRVHCNIEDWAKFLSLFLSDENPVIDGKYLSKLITPIGFYAGGWAVLTEEEQPWGKGKVLVHSGSNGIWFTSVMVAPKLNRAYIVVTNSREFGSTEGVCNEMLNKLVKMDLNRSKEVAHPLRRAVGSIGFAVTYENQHRPIRESYPDLKTFFNRP